MIAPARLYLALLLGAFTTALVAPVAVAQPLPADTIVVLDGSGSMWGQIEGTTKIEIARETLSSVLSDVPSDSNIGMMVYGHRERGECSDIEQIVPVGPASETVQPMIDAAAAINPRGMTPISEAVRQAAEILRHTERAAIVVLVTDGIETCEADPCALGHELEAAGIDFTAHVVGFGLTGEEGRQVSCLADNTGGLYFAADDAEGLNEALRQTVGTDEGDFVDEVETIEPAAEDFVEDEPDRTPRRVEFILRDSQGSPQLTIRNVEIMIEAEGDAAFEDFELYYENQPFTAAGIFEPGSYIAYVTRAESSENQIRTRLAFEVEPGTDTLTIERTIAAHLRVNTFINANEPLAPGETVRSGVAGSGGAYYWAYPVVDGVIDEDGLITDSSASFDRTLAPGTYLIRGTFARTITREKLVTLEAGTTTELDFDFGLTRVYFDVRDADGFPATRQTTFLTDQGTGTSRSIYFASGSNFSSDGDPGPFFLPEGLWRVNTGAEGGGARRAEVMVRIDGNGGEQTLRLTEAQKLSEADIEAMSGPERGPGCIARRGTSNAASACVVEEADFSDMDAPGDQSALPAPDDETLPVADAAGEGLLPPGIYGEVSSASSGSMDEFVLQDAVNACARRPVVIYPDGIMVSKVFDDSLAGAGRPPYVTANHAVCSSQGVGVQCTAREGDVGTSGPELRLELTFSTTQDGHLDLSFPDGTPGSLFYACVRPGGEMDATETLPDGRRAIDHIMARTDGGPELAYADDGTYQGQAPGREQPSAAMPMQTPEPGGDFTTIAGLYGLLDRSQSYPLEGEDLLDQCYFSGLTLFPDGLAQGFSPNYSAEPPPPDFVDPVVPTMHMFCSGTADSAQCEAYQGGYPGNGGDRQIVTMTRTGPDALRLCEEGATVEQCRTAQKCENPREAFAQDLPAPDGLPWFEPVLTRQDRGPPLPE